MKLIVSGSRDAIIRPLELMTVIQREFGFISAITEIIHGASGNVDECAGELADLLFIPQKRFYADWDKHGRKAGPLRNREMAKYAAGNWCLAIWDGKSRGTKNMIEEAGKTCSKVIWISSRNLSN